LAFAGAVPDADPNLPFSPTGAPVSFAPPVVNEVVAPPSAAPEESQPDKKSGKVGKIALWAAVEAAVVAFVVSFIFFTFAGQQSSKWEGNGFGSAEAAATGYVEALRSADPEQIFGCYAIETLAEHYNMQAALERAQAYTPTMSGLPSETALGARINATTFAADAAQLVTAQWAQIGEMGFDPTETVMFTEGGNEAAEFYDRLTNTFTTEYLTSILDIEISNLEAIDPSVAQVATAEQFQRTMEATREIYGADELVEIPVLFSAKTNPVSSWSGDYILYLQLLRYGDSWYVSPNISNTAMLMGIPSTSGGLTHR
jgi:hypothetical protein